MIKQALHPAGCPPAAQARQAAPSAAAVAVLREARMAADCSAAAAVCPCLHQIGEPVPLLDAHVAWWLLHCLADWSPLASHALAGEREGDPGRGPHVKLGQSMQLLVAHTAWDCRAFRHWATLLHTPLGRSPLRVVRSEGCAVPQPGTAAVLA